jgi:hypothetical protein
VEPLIVASRTETVAAVFDAMPGSVNENDVVVTVASDGKAFQPSLLFWYCRVGAVVSPEIVPVTMNAVFCGVAFIGIGLEGFAGSRPSRF